MATQPTASWPTLRHDCAASAEIFPWRQVVAAAVGLPHFPSIFHFQSPAPTQSAEMSLYTASHMELEHLDTFPAAAARQTVSKDLAGRAWP